MRVEPGMRIQQAFTKPNACPYPFELFPKSLLRTPSSGTCKTHSRLKTEIRSHRGWWQNLKLQQTLWTSSLIDLLLEYNTQTHTQSCNFNRVWDKAAEEEETYMYLIKERRPLFLFGYYWKTQLQSWEQQWVPKSTNKWSSEHRKGFEKRGETQQQQGTEASKAPPPPPPPTRLELHQQGVRHTVTLPFTLKSILRQKKNYENSNILPCKKSSKTKSKSKILQDIITLL